MSRWNAIIAAVLWGSGLTFAQSPTRDASADRSAEISISDPTTALPDDIETLARWYPTGVVATIQAVEGVRIAPLAGAPVAGGRGPVGAFIGYRVRIDEVVYDRTASRAPVEQGAILVVEDLVGIQGYKQFRAGEVRLRPGARCLLTMTFRPDGHWLLAGWPNQFRRVGEHSEQYEAKAVMSGFEPALRTTGLLQRDGGAAERVDWQRLIAALQTADAVLRARR
jgi:hypothetical protein